jgi:putative tryptophan/tyrosine transport system substrate-binding protein
LKKKFIGRALGAMLLALSFPAHAQQSSKIPRVGVLSLSSANTSLEAFKQGLHQLGYVEGKNIAFEYRWAEGHEDRFPILAGELLRMNVDIIVATTSRGARAAQQLTRTTPIVTTAIPDPVVYGLVNSPQHPGRNVTGLSFVSSQLGGKRLELLKEIIPGFSRVAVLSNVIEFDNPAQETSIKEVAAVAQSLSVQLQILNVKKPEEIENAFSSMIRGKIGGLMVMTPSMFWLNRARIVELAVKSRVPAIYPDSRFTDAGGLMSYGPNYAELYHRAAYFVDRILKGSKPEDLPVEQPTKFELVINLKAAKEIGLTIPTEVLMWADRVIK